MNYKKIPFNTIREIHPKIEALAKSIGAPPTGTKPDGTPYYTVPIIQDRGRGVVISDSTTILAYLDRAYPETPTVNPKGSETLQKAFRANFERRLPAYMALIAPRAIKDLPAEAQEYCRIQWAPFLGENEVEVGVAMKGVKDALDEIAGWMEEGQVFVMGDFPIDVDFQIGGFLSFVKIGLHEDSKEWKEIISWSNGRWGKMLRTLEKY